MTHSGELAPNSVAAIPRSALSTRIFRYPHPGLGVSIRIGVPLDDSPGCRIRQIRGIGPFVLQLRWCSDRIGSKGSSVGRERRGSLVLVGGFEDACCHELGASPFAPAGSFPPVPFRLEFSKARNAREDDLGQGERPRVVVRARDHPEGFTWQRPRVYVTSRLSVRWRLR